MATVTASNREWLEASLALQEFSRLKGKSGDFSFRVRRLLRVVVPLGEDIAESREEVLEKYAKKGANGDTVMLGENGVALTDPLAYKREMRELMGRGQSLTLEPLKKEELDKEGIVITGELNFHLGPLLLDAAMTADGVQEVALAEPPPE